MSWQQSQYRPSFGIAVVAVIVWSTLGVIHAQGQGKVQAQERGQQQWEQQAEQAFRMRRGTGRQLMTQEEWQAHNQRMQHMTAQERERYRHEWHTRMQERAKERGLALPEHPRPHDYGRGSIDDMGRGYGRGGGRGRR